jgi:hypothetical protein
LGLRSLEASNEAELRAIVTRLCDDPTNYESTVADQWRRIASAGLNKPYFSIVKSSIEALIV